MNDKTRLIAIGLSALATIFFVSTAFGILPWKYAIFLGVACVILAGAVRRAAAQKS